MKKRITESTIKTLVREAVLRILKESESYKTTGIIAVDDLMEISGLEDWLNTYDDEEETLFYSLEKFLEKNPIEVVGEHYSAEPDNGIDEGYDVDGLSHEWVSKLHAVIVVGADELESLIENYALQNQELIDWYEFDDDNNWER